MTEDDKALIVSIEARLSKLDKGLDKAYRTTSMAMRKMEREAARAAKKMDTALAGGVQNITARFSGLTQVLAGVFTAAAVRDALNYADAIADTAQKLAIGTDALQEWRFAAQEAGLEATAFDGALESFRSKIGGVIAALPRAKVTGDVLARLGLSAEDLTRAGDAEGQLRLIADAISRIDDASVRGAIADRLGVGAIVPLLSQGSAAIDGFIRKAREMGAVMDKDAIAKGADMQRQFEILAQTLRNDFVEVVIALGPALQAGANAMVAALDFVADNADELIMVTGALAAVLIGRFAGTAIPAAIGGVAAYIAQLRVAVAWSAAFGTASTGAAAAVAGMGARMLAFFGGPIGLAIAGVGTAVAVYASNLDDASESADRAAASTGQIIDALELVEQMHRQAGTAVDDLSEAYRLGLKPGEDAAAISRALAEERRKEAVATLTAAKAEADLRAARAREKAQAAAAAVLTDAGGARNLINTPGGIAGGLQAATDAASEYAKEAVLAEAASKELDKALKGLASGVLSPTGNGNGGGSVPKVLDAAAEKAKKAREEFEKLAAKRRDRSGEVADFLSWADGVSGEQTQKDWDALGVEAYAEARSSFASAFADGIMEGIQTGDWRGVLESALSEIANNFLRRALEDLGGALYDTINGMGGGGGGKSGLGGILSSVIGGLFGGGGGGAGAAWTKSGWGMFSGRASGGPVTAGTPYIVGEKRPELFVPNVSGRIVPRVPDMRGMGASNSYTFAPVVDARGADMAAIARLEGALQRQQSEFQSWAKGEAGRTVGHVRNARQRRQLRV